MKLLLLSLLAITTSLLLFVPTAIHAIVAGVDFGGEFFKIALVKPGTPFEIVTNVHSKRKTETMVAFDGEERLYGADAATVGVRRPQTAYAQIRRFLGTTAEDPAVVSLVQDEYFPYELLQNNTRGTISLKHSDEKTFHAEEVVAMVFTHARQITNAFAEASVRDYVVTVPDFYTQSQRQAMLDAAEISGVRVLSLINENTAAALQLAVHSTFTEEPKRILFYNMGSTSLIVSIVEFSSQIVPDGFKKNKTISTFEIKSRAWDDALGGSHFDLRLAEALAKEFSTKVGEDIRTIPRPMAKIRTLAKKTKTVLSANEQIPVVLQALYKDMDFFTTMTRSQLEEMCADLFTRALEPVKRALAQANLQPQDIDEIEIIGGGVRMPKIQQELKDYFQEKELGVHLNGDEAMALGAAFHAANLSSTFRVRHVGMTDVATYAVGVRLIDLDQSHHKETEENEKHWVKRASLFTESNRLGMRKSVSFTHSKDISATFRYDQPSTLPKGASSHIAKYNITGIETFVEKYKEKELGEPKITFSFELDGSGLVQIVKAEATLEEEYEVEVVVKKDKKNKKEKEEEKEKQEEKKEEDEEEKEEKEEKVMEMKKRIHRGVLLVTHAHSTWDAESGMSVLPMSIAEKKESMVLLREMERADLERRANLEAKNRLESFVYKARDTLSAQENEIQQVTTTEQVEQLNTQLETTEDWLYDEGEKVNALEYTKKIQTLEKEFNAILFRVKEKKFFPMAMATAKEYAFSTKALMNEWIESKPQVTEAERKDVLEKVDDLEKWLETAQKKQEQAPVHEPPVVTSVEVEKQVQNVKKLVNSLSKRPKPKPIKTEVEVETEEKEKKEGEEEKKEEKEGEEKEEVHEEL